MEKKKDWLVGNICVCIPKIWENWTNPFPKVFGTFYINPHTFCALPLWKNPLSLSLFLSLINGPDPVIPTQKLLDL